MSSDLFLSLPGAVVSDSLGSPTHFGEPLLEQRALEQGKAVVSMSHTGVVTVTGIDRLTWLHSMTSQHLTRLQPGESTETLLLDPNGRVLHAIRVVDDGSTAWLLVDQGAAQSLVEYLQRMRFALRVEVADRSDSVQTVAVFGGEAATSIRSLGLSLIEWQDPWSHVTPGGIQYARSTHPGSTWNASQFVFDRTDVESVIQLIRSGSLLAAGTLAIEALEIRAWRPTAHGEIDERALPHEFDWLRSAVHLEKGCYRGQETVAKVHNLGHPPRRLALLHLDGSGGELPPSGALVFSAIDSDRPVGRVTRSALHHEWGGLALALLKRTVDETSDLFVSLADTTRVPATQEVIVPSDAGATRRAQIQALRAL